MAELGDKMNEWALQDLLTSQWSTKGPCIPPFGQLDLIAWEVMFPSWEINYSGKRWNEPSIDFVFRAASGGFVLLELKAKDKLGDEKDKIKNDERLLSAFCQVTDRAFRFVNSYSHEKLLRSHARCLDGECGRHNAAFTAIEFTDSPVRVKPADVHRVIATVSPPRRATARLGRLNQETFPNLVAQVTAASERNKTNKKNKEYPRFLAISATEYAELAASPISTFDVSEITLN